MISITVADRAWSKVPRLHRLARHAAKQALDYVVSPTPSPEVRAKRASKGGAQYGTAVPRSGAPFEAPALRASAPQGSRKAPSESFDVAIRFTSDTEVADLNKRWRGKNRATNVLSFPTPLQSRQSGQLGDIVLASGVVAAEAKDQGKSVEAHTAHLIVHGVLHLLGFDHQAKHQASRMEKAEVAILARMGYENPYILA
jgi:probable rRNA maturation factor